VTFPIKNVTLIPSNRTLFNIHSTNETITQLVSKDKQLPGSCLLKLLKCCTSLSPYRVQENSNGYSIFLNPQLAFKFLLNTMSCWGICLAGVDVEYALNCANYVINTVFIVACSTQRVSIFKTLYWGLLQCIHCTWNTHYTSIGCTYQTTNIWGLFLCNSGFPGYKVSIARAHVTCQIQVLQ